MKKCDFAANVEKLIDPIEVGTIHFIQSFNDMLPKKIQRKIVKASAKKTPQMGFVVEPYSYFLCYEIKDLEKAKDLIPDGFKLIKTRIFKDDKPKYYCILGCFNAHTSAFWGVRVEFYVIAEDIKTGLLSWVIVDYDTNTISYDESKGLSKPNSRDSIITTDCKGNLLVDINRDDKTRSLKFNSNIEKGKTKKLDQRLWLEGNLSIGYGKELSNNSSEVFSLKFNPDEVEKALKIPNRSTEIQINSWYPGLFEEKPSQMVCFPYAQHFISDSPGHSSNLKNKEELMEATKNLDFKKMKVYSSNSFKKMITVVPLISFLVSLVLLILLILK
jgi:hypothetical protein